MRTTAHTDGTGTAILPISQFAGGTHNVFASFSGASQYAPSVSPALVEQFPSGSPGFALGISGNSILLSRGVSGSIMVTVAPAEDFSQLIQLACVHGVPASYECSFSPPSLYSGGSNLTIQPLIHRANSSRSGARLYLAVIIVCVAILLGKPNGRDVRYFLVLVVLVLTACGNPSTSAEPQITVLSIQATAGSGTSEVIHSAQVNVIVRN